jgi:hypothetical protein
MSKSTMPPVETDAFNGDLRERGHQVTKTDGESDLAVAADPE